MSVITPSDAVWRLTGLDITQARYDLAEMSDATGHTAARLFGPPRWRMAVRSAEAMTLAQAGEWEALVLQLRGGVNHLAAWDTVRTAPQGTLRGSPTLNGSHAAGATTLVLANARGTNLLLGGGFELDANVDTLADGWSYYSYGTGAGSSGGLVNGPTGKYQHIDFTDVSTGLVGVSNSTLSAAGSVAAGRSYSFGADVYLSHADLSLTLYVAFLDGGGSVLSSAQQSWTGSAGAWARRSLTFTTPASTQGAVCYAWVGSSTASTYAGYMLIDNAQLEQGAASAFTPTTLLPGDWLQVGTGLGTSQLVKVVQAATANDAGAMSVVVEPPLRQTFGNGTAVAWNKPLGYYKLLGMPTWGYRPGVAKGTAVALDLLEAFQ